VKIHSNEIGTKNKYSEETKAAETVRGHVMGKTGGLDSQRLKETGE